MEEIEFIVAIKTRISELTGCDERLVKIKKMKVHNGIYNARVMIMYSNTVYKVRYDSSELNMVIEVYERTSVRKASAI